MKLKKYRIDDIADLNRSCISKIDTISDIEYLDTSNITENVIFDTYMLNIDNAPSRAQRKVSDKTILYSTVRPRLKHYGILNSPKDNFIVSTGFVTIDIKEQYKEEIDATYLYLLLTQPSITEYISNIADTAVSSYPSINPSDIASIEFKFPSYGIQKLVANIWSAFDRKIELNRAINQNLEAMAKQLYDYWFVQFDFPNEEGKPYKSSGGTMVWNEKLKREIPKGWNNGTLIDIANITMGQSPDGTSYNEIGEGVLFYQGSTDFGMRFPSVRQYTTAPSRFAKKGDILMSVRAPVGAVNIANKDCCIGRGLSALNSKIGSITHLYYILNDLRIAFDQRNAAGTTFGSITKEDLYSLPIVIPAKEVISAFDKICSPIFDRLMLLGEEIDTLIKQRDEFLPLLMNGQVSINSDLSAL